MSWAAPGFWQKRGILSAALSPLGAVYHVIVQRRLAKPGLAAPCPVICVGNATMGGVGKTPFVRMLINVLREEGINAHILTRGYGGTAQGPYRVNAGDDPAHVGDEPLMLAQDQPVWVAKDRAQGALAIAAEGAQVIIMDDGFQNPSLQKSLSLMLVDADNPFGNGLVFPAGPLRERPDTAANRADALVAVTRGPDAGIPTLISEWAGSKPLFRAWFEVEKSSIPEGPIVAFCGIGRPERFRRSLEDNSASLLDFCAFPDHHRFSDTEISALKSRAAADGAKLITTEKDFVRLASPDQNGITPIRGAMRCDDRAVLLRLVKGPL